MIESKDPLRDARAAAIAIKQATRRRDHAIVAARDEGRTWRSIAEAVGMTDLGVRNIYRRVIGEEDSESDHELWNTTQVASYLGIKPGTISAYRQRGQMPAPVQTIGARTHLWDAATIRAWRPRVDDRG